MKQLFKAALRKLLAYLGTTRRGGRDRGCDFATSTAQNSRKVGTERNCQDDITLIYKDSGGLKRLGMYQEAITRKKRWILLIIMQVISESMGKNPTLKILTQDSCVCWSMKI